MFSSTPIRLTALAVMLLALTLAALRHSGSQRSFRPLVPANQLVSAEISVPVEIIEVGEEPAMLEIRVRP